MIKARMEAYESVFGKPEDDDDEGDFDGDFIPEGEFGGDAI